MSHSDKLAETHDRLVNAVESLTTGDEWRKMLDVARRFHTYSPNNIWLIFAQRPDATRVAGFHTWRKLGRSVQAGEHGIAILAPCVYRGRPVDDTDEREHPALARILRGFRVVHVFDVAQTTGADIDDVTPVLLEGDAPGIVWVRLAEEITAGGFSLQRGDCSPANGVTDFSTRVVTVRPDLSALQATKTLAHELAHTRLHGGDNFPAGCRGIAEVEAESVAHLICAAAGLTTDEYTFPYVARWANGDVALVRKTAERVITCARDILAATGLVVTERPLVDA